MSQVRTLSSFRRYAGKRNPVCGENRRSARKRLHRGNVYGKHLWRFAVPRVKLLCRVVFCNLSAMLTPERELMDARRDKLNLDRGAELYGRIDS